MLRGCAGSPGRLWPRAKNGQELERERSCGSKNRKKKRKGWQQIEHASLRPHLWVQEHQSDAQKRGGRRQSALSEGPSLTDEETEEEDEEEDEEVPSPREASKGPKNVDEAEQAAAREAASSSAAGAVCTQEVSSEDEDAQPMDPLEPWQRRMVSKKLAQCKEEVATTPGGTDLGYHLLLSLIIGPHAKRFCVRPHEPYQLA